MSDDGRKIFISVAGTLLQEDAILKVEARRRTYVDRHVKTADAVVVTLLDGSEVSVVFNTLADARSAVADIATKLNIKATLEW